MTTVEQITITFPDATKKKYPSGITPAEIVEEIGGRLKSSAIAAIVGDKKVDLSFQIKNDASLRILTFADKEGMDIFWHSSSHVMAHAVKEVFPDAKFGIGPAIDTGFYYDVDVGEAITKEDLEKIEEKMH